jgi:flavodoxin I
MNILLVFATNSGTTMMTAQSVSDGLTQKGHTVTMKEVKTVTADEVANAEMVIFGSPSWDFDGKEGMPHEDYMPIMNELKTKTLEGKKFAIFGLGDSSYTHFTGAVDHLEELVKTMKGTLLVPSLRIDKFFSDQAKHMEAITSWTESVASVLK